ncbi:Tyrosine recombinase XerC [compost metagenome]
MAGKKKLFHLYAEAQRSVRELGIVDSVAYKTQYHFDPMLPSHPQRIYANRGWKDWYDFLGIVKPERYLSYAEAQKAAQLLGVTSRADYLLCFTTDPSLPRKPERVFAGKGWTRWNKYLGTERRASFYLSYSKAEAAAQSLGVSTSREYQLRYREDQKLPANPHVYYNEKGWVDWKTFLGMQNPYYVTYAEAASAAKALCITSLPIYKMRKSEDPRLPPHPEVLYANAGWTGFHDFFGKEKKGDFYCSYSDAQAAAVTLNARTRDSYNLLCRKDPRLPSQPQNIYRGQGWSDWSSFLGAPKRNFYKNYTEARKAAQALGIKTSKEYLYRYLEDPKLYANPSKVYADWKGWYHFLGNKAKKYYPYQEAQSVVQNLGITKEKEYKERHSKDPKLPPSPKKYYKNSGWKGFRSFVGKSPFYATLAQAKAAALAMQITNSSDYKLRYREDHRLPSEPKSFYSTEWISWNFFLNIKKRDSYRTYSQAREAVQALGIKSISEYRTRYFEDPKLPAAPLVFYSESTDWYDFLGNTKPDYYSTLSEAKEAVQILGVKTRKQYIARYKEDPRLPTAPDSVFANYGWLDWYDFLGKDRPVNFTLRHPNLWGDVKQWLDDQTNLVQKKKSLKRFIAGYYLPQELPDETRHLLMRSSPFNSEGYRQFIEDQPEYARRPTHGHILSFYSWALNEYCTDTDGHEAIVLSECRNPFETIMAGFADSLHVYRPTQSTKVPLGYEYILRARQYLVPDSEHALVKQPKFKDLPHLQELFCTRIDWSEVDEKLIDREDPNCVWRIENVKRVIDGKQQWIRVCQVWSPVRFVALYTLLRFPLRSLQISLLDSGEADAEMPFLDQEHGKVTWKKNLSSLVSKGSKKPRAQGMIQRGEQGLPKIYVTTNKTGVGEGGYEVEWVPDDLIYWFITLRDWQTKYNPLSEPTSWISIQRVLGKDRLNKKILQARGTQCFLFRTDSSGKPLHTRSAFEYTLPLLLYRIQRDGENLASKPDSMARSKYLSVYTPHSLRVSLITAFIADGDAPIHLISKLVGHSSLVMTIYYVKLSSQQMRRTMGETEKRAAQRVAEGHANTIRLEGLHPVRDQLIVTDGNRSLIEADVPNSACVVFDWGICPMSASGCHIGGPELKSGQNEVFSAVVSGYLGQKNCPRCRFFVTGIPFLGGLVALANEISLEIYTESGRFEEFSRMVRKLEAEFYDASLAGEPDTKQWERKQATANEQQSGGKLDGLLNDYVQVNHFIQACLSLMNDKNSNQGASEDIRLVVSGDLLEVGASIQESTTQYHLLSEICQNATIYRSANPSRAVPLISQAIDRMAENNHLKPAMFRLTDQQKLVVINELNHLLLSRLGSWERIDDLFSGDLMLLDIDAYKPKMTRISNEIQNILTNGATRPLSQERAIHE